MKIKEYIVIRDEEQYPCLKIKEEFEWKKNFLESQHIIDFLNQKYYMNQLNEEYMYVISLNCQMKPLGVFQISHGNWFSTDLKMRELGIFLLLTGAERFVIAHNHPTGNCQPSQGDFEITNKMNEFANLIDIQMMQHYIIGGDDWDGVIYDEDEDEEDYEDKKIDNEMPFGLE